MPHPLPSRWIIPLSSNQTSFLVTGPQIATSAIRAIASSPSQNRKLGTDLSCLLWDPTPSQHPLYSGDAAPAIPRLSSMWGSSPTRMRLSRGPVSPALVRPPDVSEPAVALQPSGQGWRRGIIPKADVLPVDAESGCLRAPPPPDPCEPFQPVMLHHSATSCPESGSNRSRMPVRPPPSRTA
jgi:hypothetical protein